jgi:hypothetical protein
MKRFLLLLLVVLAVPAGASAAISGVGGGTTISNGQATLVSNSTSPFSFISFDDLNSHPVGDLTDLEANVVSAQYGGGAPRFSVVLSNGTDTKSIFVYLGDLPNLTTGSKGGTGNLLDSNTNGARVDSTQLGGPFYGTLQDALTAAANSGYTTISEIDFVVDASFATGGSQTVVIDSATINGTTYDFSPASKDDCKNGGWQLFGFKNQGECVSSFGSGK